MEALLTSKSNEAGTCYIICGRFIDMNLCYADLFYYLAAGFSPTLGAWSRDCME